MWSRTVCKLLVISAVSLGISSAQSPAITTLNPSGAGSGGSAFALTISGTNFGGGAAVYWNGNALQPTAASSTLLTVTVPAALIASPGTAMVNVVNPDGGVSNFAVFTVYEQPLSITTTALPAGTAGTAYSFQMAAMGGKPPYAWAADTIPAGLILSPAGLLGGTPKSAGTFNITLTVLDSGNSTKAQTFALTINPPPLSIVTDAALPQGTASVTYSQTLFASGGMPPYKWSMGAGAPSGLTLNASTGVLSGTPAAKGSYTFNIQATDSSGTTANKAYTLTIQAPPINITTNSVFGGTVGQPYSQTFTASGGTPPYKWSLSSGSSGGLALDPASGALTGTPTSAGTSIFTITVTDSSGATASKPFTFTVAAPQLTITTNSQLPAAGVGAPYSQAFSATGGNPPYTWLINAGTVPGLALNAATGVLSGTPTTPGSYTLTVQAKDNVGVTAAKSFSLTVNPATLTITSTAPLPAATAGAPFSQAIAASGGTPPYTWTSNAMPAGLAVDPSTGLISGSPTAAGSFTFTLTVTDSARQSATGVFQIRIGAPALPDITITGLPDTADPATQPVIGLQLAAPYSLPLSGQLILSFAPDAGGGDGTIQFATGGRTVSFQIPAGSTAAVFPVSTLAVQTGTVAGTIRISAQLQSSGAGITPVPAPDSSARINAAAPVITSAQLVRNATGFQVQVTGYSTTRELTQAVFEFSATAGNTLQATRVTVPLGDVLGKWYSDPSSIQYGSQFSYSQPFTTQGDPNAVLPQSVTLTNSVGSTTAAVTQ